MSRTIIVNRFIKNGDTIRANITVDNRAFTFVSIAPATSKFDAVTVENNGHKACVLLTQGGSTAHAAIAQQGTFGASSACPTCKGTPNSTVFEAWMFLITSSTSISPCPEEHHHIDYV